MPLAATYITGIASALDDFAIYTAASGTVSTAVITLLVNNSGNVSVNQFDDAWLYNATDAQQRHVKPGSYIASNGTLGFYPDGLTPAGDALWMTHLFPVVEAMPPTMTSYLTIATRSLAMLKAYDQITIPINASEDRQTVYPLTTQSFWLDRKERMGWNDGSPVLLEPHPFGGAPVPADWRRPLLRFDGGVPTLVIEAPFVPGTTGNMTLNVTRPGHSLVNGSESTNGLVLTTDTALPSLTDVIQCGLLEAYTLLAQRGQSTPTGGSYAGLIGPQLGKCRALKMFDDTVWRDADREGRLS